MAEYHLTAPLTEEDVTKLKLGDTVYIRGKCFTCRSRLQKHIFDEKNVLPFETDDRNVLIHNGPIVIKENGKWKLRMIIGKTTMGKETAKMMKEKKCVHASPRSISPNLWIDSIEVEDVYLYDELGKIEAAWFFNLKDLGPFIVDIDTEENNYFDRLDEDIATRKNQALKKLGIDENYQFTKLY